MTTQFEINCALMAGRTYQTNRDPNGINWFPVPSGWNEYLHIPNNTSPSIAGFEMSAFQSTTNPNEIVISYAGTDPTSISDLWADGKLALGFTSTQLLQAAEYYIAVKSANPDAKITFAGHSLGGGLAALMGVFFNQTAVTFDQAPFLASATQSVATDVLNDLLAKFPPATNLQIMNLLAPLTGFINQTNLLSDSLSARVANITDTNVQGEFLSSSLNPFNRIGTQTDIPNNMSGVSSGDLHAQSLLAAFLQSDASATTTTAGQKQSLGQVTFKLTDLLGMIFDPQLFYRDPNKLNNPERNLLEHLVRHEAGGVGGVSAGGDAMVARFTTDLWKLAQDGGLTMSDLNGQPNNFNTWNNVSRALIAFAMQKYYDEKTGSIGLGATLFQDVSGGGGIQFDTAAVAGAGSSITGAKGYQYFQAYLDTTSLLSPAERTLIKSMLPQLRDWYVQAGANGMNATDTLNRGAFMLGGNGADTLTGGTAADLLVGNAGTDTLQGGQGNDTLLGGSGNDTYKYNAGDGLDTILDSDGQGGIVMDGAPALAGGDQYGDASVHRSADGKHLYVQTDPNTLLIDGNIVIQNYGTGGTFGLNLSATPVADPVSTTPAIIGDFAPIDQDLATAGIQLGYDSLNNVKTDPSVPEAGRADRLNGSTGNDIIEGRGGSDILDGGNGNDRLYADTQTTAASAISLGNSQTGTGLKGDWLAGGSGDDTMVGSAGNDVLAGGGGSDLLIGGAGNDDILGDRDWVANSFDWTVTDQPDGTRYFQPLNDYPSIGAADVIYAGEGNDHAWGGAGNDVIFGEGGNDKLYGEQGNDILMGGAGIDYLYGDAGSATAQTSGNDYLDGGDNTDYLYGGAGDDILAGGKGDDFIYTGSGKDTILYNAGDGKDTIDRSGALPGEAGVVRFGAGINASQIRLGLGSLRLGLGSLKLDLGNGDEVHIAGFNRNDVFNSSSISSFEFADGTNTIDRIRRRTHAAIINISKAANDAANRAWRDAA